MNYLKTLPKQFLSSHVCSVVFRNSKQSSLQYLRRGYVKSYDGDGKTSAFILNAEHGVGLMINSISPHGFRLNNSLFIRGPAAMFPNTSLSWRVQSIEEVDEASLSLFYLIEPKLDVVVIGVGDKENWTRERIHWLKEIFDKYNIAVEVLPTENACTTFNFLASENRFVGAALIPPVKGFESAVPIEPTPGFNAFQ